MELKKGQKLWIKNVKPNKNPFGWIPEMQEYLGEEVTITDNLAIAGDKGYFIAEDKGLYLWHENCFCQNNPNVKVHVEKEISFNDFLNEFKVR